MNCFLHYSHQRPFVVLTKPICSNLDHQLRPVHGADQYYYLDALVLYYPSSYVRYHGLRNEILCFMNYVVGCYTHGITAVRMQILTLR